MFKSSSGRFDMGDSVITIGAANTTNIFTISDTLLKINRVQINVTGVVSKLRVFNFTDTVSSIMDGLQINTGISQIAEIFNLTNSKLELTNSRINSGNGKISSLLFFLDNSDLVIGDSTIESGVNSGIVSFFDARSSSIGIKSSNIKAEAEKGISLFSLQNSSFSAVKMDTSTSFTTDFTYGFRAGNSYVDCSDSSFVIEDSYDFKFAALSGSVFSFAKSDIEVIDGRYGNTLLDFNDMKSIRIYSNVFKYSGNDVKPALTISGNNRVVIQKNMFYGWDKILSYNGLSIKNSEELNTFSGFYSSPFGNKSE